MKRLTASVNVLGRENGLSRKERRVAVMTCAAEHAPLAVLGRARDYGEQTVKDHAALLRAIKSGRVKAVDEP